jgi:hypothetical protein
MAFFCTKSVLLSCANAAEQIWQSRDRFCFCAQVSLKSETRDVDHCTVQVLFSVQMPLKSWTVEPAEDSVHCYVVFNRA